jgi:hypothetical protein
MGSGFRIQGAPRYMVHGFRIHNLGFRFQGSGLRGEGADFRVLGVGFSF